MRDHHHNNNSRQHRIVLRSFASLTSLRPPCIISSSSPCVDSHLRRSLPLPQRRCSPGLRLVASVQARPPGHNNTKPHPAIASTASTISTTTIAPCASPSRGGIAIEGIVVRSHRYCWPELHKRPRGHPSQSLQLAVTTVTTGNNSAFTCLWPRLLFSPGYISSARPRHFAFTITHLRQTAPDTLTEPRDLVHRSTPQLPPWYESIWERALQPLRSPTTGLRHRR
jgi:hypothetical protein